MEQLCGWSGQVQVHEPLWLVSAVVRRLRAVFTSLGEAVTVDEPLPAPTAPTKLAQPR